MKIKWKGKMRDVTLIKKKELMDKLKVIWRYTLK